METVRRYDIEGVTLHIPLRYDEKSGKHIEDYRDFLENQRFTPLGHPILFVGEDACEYVPDAADCGSCPHFKRAAEHTWIGICTHSQRCKITPMKEVK